MDTPQDFSFHASSYHASASNQRMEKGITARWGSNALAKRLMMTFRPFLQAGV
jgi:hypothetical protein